MYPAQLISKIVEHTLANAAQNKSGEAIVRRSLARRIFDYYDALTEFETRCIEVGQTLRWLKAALHDKHVQKLQLEEWEACRLEFISERFTALTGSLVGVFEDDLDAQMIGAHSDGGRAFQGSQIYDQALAEFIEAAHAQEMDAAYAASQLARLFIWEDQSARQLRLAVPLSSEPDLWWDFYLARMDKRVLPRSSRKIESARDIAELEQTFDETAIKIRESRESVASYLRLNVTIEEIL